METQEIPRKDWQRFLADLNRRAAEHPVRLEVENIDLGSQDMATLSPLQNIALETDGSARGALEITVGADDLEFSHRIERPSRLFVRYSRGFQVDCLGIEDLDGGITLVMFDELLLLPEGVGFRTPPPEMRAP